MVVSLEDGEQVIPTYLMLSVSKKLKYEILTRSRSRYQSLSIEKVTVAHSFGVLNLNSNPKFTLIRATWDVSGQRERLERQRHT